MASSKRITKELKELSDTPPDNMDISLPDESDFHKWRIAIKGPDKTPYAGGTFVLILTLPPTYPFKPPLLSFQTKIYHPNVSNDDKGSMCLGLLRPEAWKPATKIADVLRFTMQLLHEPNPDDAVEQSIAAEYRDKRTDWEKQARDWTKKYAKLDERGK